MSAQWEATFSVLKSLIPTGSIVAVPEWAFLPGKEGKASAFTRVSHSRLYLGLQRQLRHLGVRQAGGALKPSIHASYLVEAIVGAILAVCAIAGFISCIIIKRQTGYILSRGRSAELYLEAYQIAAPPVTPRVNTHASVDHNDYPETLREVEDLSWSHANDSYNSIGALPPRDLKPQTAAHT
ncbi:hypothetical protein M422DRAFT_252939 [Sphaerobolus stellatus SS14]|uniref:Uncharacterized protein n=1 Tax=Sphaerobolus stellatus (strain SS14) TaxID=990650 RepID=A0A0C9VXQ0_SPHS4|nr:hypothetical protein M422DRAFT_252939 [Sphaerobolus stellatus SS14]